MRQSGGCCLHLTNTGAQLLFGRCEEGRTFMSARKPADDAESKRTVEAAEKELGITTEPLEDLSIADEDAEAVKGGTLLLGQNITNQGRHF
jgi:hypothetical protein